MVVVGESAGCLWWAREQAGAEYALFSVRSVQPYAWHGATLNLTLSCSWRESARKRERAPNLDRAVIRFVLAAGSVAWAPVD